MDLNDEPVPPGIDSPLMDVPMPQNPPSMDSPKIQTSSKGVEFAKKRLRAFSIQKKTPLPPVGVVSPSLSPLPTGAPGVVVIGKLANAKVPIPLPKFPLPSASTAPMVTMVEDIEDKRKKPPKPGSCDTYMDLKKRTLSEIEDMKRKMELVELGIPLGLIGPTLNSPAAKAMPTKAMPPIKTFLTTEQLDKIIAEAKKAKAEGREFKFDYQKLLPEYENPFQRKKDRATEEEREKEQEVEKKEFYEKLRQRERSRSHGLDYKRKERRERDIRDRRSRERKKEKDKRDKKDRSHEKVVKKDTKAATKEKSDKPESDLNINDFLVCDSWSLDNDDKNDTSSPKVDLKVTEKVTEKVPEEKPKETLEQIQEKLEKEKQSIIEKRLQKKMAAKLKPIEKLQPVTDSFSFEIEEDAILDIFDEENDLEKYAKAKTKTDSIKSDQDSQDTKDSNEDFLESVINEIKQEDLSEDESQDKGLVEYEMSPDRDSDNTPDVSLKSGSVTPELNDSMRSSQMSNYSDLKLDESGIKSTESGVKSTESGVRSTESGVRSKESGVKSTESGVKSTESGYRSESLKETPKDVRSPESYRSADNDRMTRSTVDALETWSFVMKICQPLLFRHDRNKCYKETKALPSLWYTENPKLCDCVKDRSIVYEELETLKTELVDRVYSCEQMAIAPPLASRTWYPSPPLALSSPPQEPPPVSRALEWESDEDATPRRKPDVTLVQEYQRFMDAVWPEISEAKPESRSTTPVKEDKVRKKKKLAEDTEKKAKKIKLNENWSQESDVEEDKSTKKTKAVKKVKSRKRKHSSSTITETSDDGDDKKVKKKSPKKKDAKRKAKLAKRRRMEKLLKKQKNKNKKIKKFKVKTEKIVDVDSDDEKTKKAKKKKKLKLKKKDLKKKRTKSTSSDSDSDGKDKKRKRNEDKKKTKKRQSSESQSDDLFDVNILKNIKTEKEEKKLEEFSPRRQQNKQREIISMKELQTNLETGNVQIKQEVEENNSSLESCSAELLDQAYEEKAKIEEPQQRIQQIQEPQQQIQEPHQPIQEPQQQIQEPQQPIQEPQKPIQEPIKPIQEPQQPIQEPQKIESISESKQNDPILRSEFISPDGNMEEYDMYEQMAMEYQSGVKSQQTTTPTIQESVSIQKIETVVSRASRGEIKCDWRPGAAAAPAPPARPSRWGLKPGEANIVLTQPAAETFPIRSVLEDDYMDNDVSMNYDEAYAHMYGASDRLQYGDCFSGHEPPPGPPDTPQGRQRGSLDDRINTVFEEQARNEANGDKNILDSKPSEPVKVQKRVSFADGYKPGQDSDVEEPPIKRKKRRRVGCAWPCPASHPDHVPLWDALPPPPPPPSPPPPQPRGAPPHLLRPPPRPQLLTAPMAMGIKFDPNSIPGLLQEPPPGMMALPHGSI